MRIKTIRTKETTVRVISRRGEHDQIEIKAHQKAILKMRVPGMKLEPPALRPSMPSPEALEAIFKSFSKESAP